MQYVEEAHVQRRHGTTQELSLNVVCRFLDFMITDSRIIRNLTVKKYLGAGLMLLITYLLLF